MPNIIRINKLRVLLLSMTNQVVKQNVWSGSIRPSSQEPAFIPVLNLEFVRIVSMKPEIRPWIIFHPFSHDLTPFCNRSFGFSRSVRYI